MAETHRPSPLFQSSLYVDHHQLLHPPPPTPHGLPPAHHHLRLGAVRGGGEIVEVEGGHIVRSIGRKDRHSKVFTSKGPRDRRVRLSAHTAIQFYDVQDRLGYDRPSKAVDWLIKNAQAAIDELAELPPRRPMAGAVSFGPAHASEQEQRAEAATAGDETREKPMPEEEEEGEEPSATYGFAASSFLPPSLDTDAIADTIKSFFPMAGAPASAGTSSSPKGGFQSYPPQLPHSSAGQAQDLRLSLQSFREPVVLLQQRQPQESNATSHHHHHQQFTGHAAEQASLFSSSSAHLPFDAASAGWPELSQRTLSWNASAETGVGGGYILLPPPQQATPLHPVLGQSPFLSQRGPLQSSSSHHVRAWADPSAAEAAAPLPLGLPFSAAGFPPAGVGGFRIPARIQGDEEQDGADQKPSSASLQ